MVARRALQIGLLAVVAAIVLFALDSFQVGLDPLPESTGDLQQDLINGFEADESAYLMWGRWTDLSTAVAFAAALVAMPSLHAIRPGLHLAVAGSAIAVVGDLIDLSQLVGRDVARFALDNELSADFAAGLVFAFGINTTSTFVWIGGLVLLGLGLLVASVGMEGRWRMTNRAFGLILLLVAAADIWASGVLLDVSYVVLAAGAVWWFASALGNLTDA